MNQLETLEGDYIYHFTSEATALLYILPSLQLKLSNYCDTNDPRENKLLSWNIFEQFDSLNRFNEVRSAVTIKIEFEEYLKNNCKILCFSNDYKVNKIGGLEGYNHPRMWAQYSNKHKGVCFVLDKKEFIKENKGFYYKKMKYSNTFEYPKLDSNNYYKSINHEKYFYNFLKANIKELFYKKHVDWSSEHESRLLSFNSKKQFCLIEKSLCRLYLGVNFDPNLYPALVSLLQKKKDLQIRRLYIEDGRLKFHPIEPEIISELKMKYY